jgi:hypothetical protein
LKAAPRSKAPMIRPAPRAPSTRLKSVPGPRPPNAAPAPRVRSTAPKASPRARTGPTTPTPGARDKRGRLARSEQAKRDFLKSTGHPNGWPGHVVDHKIPLACGGTDAPSNMQWQTTVEGKAKDKVERIGCQKSR